MARRDRGGAAAEPLYLRSVRIKNVRCFEDVQFDLNSSAGPRMWGVIFGDNGVGKTSLLRCIAMGLCDEASASGLLREIYGQWNRQLSDDPLPAEIHLDFFPTQPGEKIRIITNITPSSSGYSQVRQKTYFPGRKSGDFPWDRIFACGYGAARRAFGTKDIDEYATVDSVYTLFNYDTPLQNPELVLRRLQRGPAQRKTLLKSIAHVLMLPEDAIALNSSGLAINGPWGNFQPIGGLGDGYQATLAWLTDLLGWALMYDPEAPISEVRGIVLVDELEQHLHPRWQRKIISLLREHFPRVQFIATTHTPMVAIGTTDLSDEECELIVLERDEAAVNIAQDISPPRGRWADQVLTSRLFQLPTAGDDAVVYRISRYNQLKTKRTLTQAEKKECSALNRELSSTLGSAESDFEETVRRAVAKVLRDKADKTIDSVAANFEVLRQLRELAKK